jgi:hypothetical protein
VVLLVERWMDAEEAWDKVEMVMVEAYTIDESTR